MGKLNIVVYDTLDDLYEKISSLSEVDRQSIIKALVCYLGIALAESLSTTDNKINVSYEDYNVEISGVAKYLAMKSQGIN